jgi:GT2 family glycosyltransferase
MSAHDNSGSLTPRVTVSVVSHGHREMIVSLLRQLADLSDLDVGRVVVTHNLPDDDLKRPAHAGYELVQIHNAKPIGFAANHNRAFSQCNTLFFAVLNPDIEFQFGNPFPALLDAMVNDARLGAVAPALVQPVTLHIEPNRRIVTPLELVQRRLPGYKPPAEPDWLVGAFLLIQCDVYKVLGGFDEGFRLYCEDVDFGVRMRSSGWVIRRIEIAKVVHMTQRRSHYTFKFTFLHLMSLLRFWTKLVFVGSPLNRERRKIGKHP